MFALLERQENVGPEVARFTQSEGEIDSVHAGGLVAGHCGQLTDDVVEGEGLADGLRCTGLQSNMDNVDVKVVIGRLVVDIKLEHVGFDLGRVQFFDNATEMCNDALQPGHVSLVQVSQAPYVSPFNQGEQMETPYRLSIPVEVGQQQEPFVFWGCVGVCAEQDVLLLCPPLYDVEDPVQTTLITLTLHKGADMVCVDFRGLCDEADRLGGVFLDVFLCARVDEIDLQIWRLLHC